MACNPLSAREGWNYMLTHSTTMFGKFQPIFSSGTSLPYRSSREEIRLMRAPLYSPVRDLCNYIYQKMLLHTLWWCYHSGPGLSLLLFQIYLYRAKLKTASSRKTKCVAFGLLQFPWQFEHFQFDCFLGNDHISDCKFLLSWPLPLGPTSGIQITTAVVLEAWLNKQYFGGSLQCHE